VDTEQTQPNAAGISTVRTWGTFTDLSVGGCYVELKATFPVGAIIDPRTGT
jgi:hypothetical protein